MEKKGSRVSQLWDRGHKAAGESPPKRGQGVRSSTGYGHAMAARQNGRCNGDSVDSAAAMANSEECENYWW